MKVLHFFVKDLGGEFPSDRFPIVATSFGEVVPEEIANVYSGYFTASGLAPVRIRLRMEDISVGSTKAVLRVDLKLFAFGVVILEYLIEPTSPVADPNQLFHARSVERASGETVTLNALWQADMALLRDRLYRDIKREYDDPAFTDHFHLFIDHEKRPEEEAMAILLPGEESYSTPIKRRIVQRIQLWEESESCYIMGSRGYLGTALNPFDIVNFMQLARMQLYELKVYDHILDKSIEDTYAFLDKLPQTNSVLPFSWLHREFQEQVQHATKLLAVRMDLVDLVKDITNTTKITDDPYFELVYRNLMDAFRVREWFDSVKDKIEEVEASQKMILDRLDMVRSTTLEMTIIALIAVEIIVPFGHWIMSFVR
ncbi:MAG TPA: hypothetical protein PKO06_01225 [Candidatus Ozemobacteraceae bacterium]|nr:hypothetical protein [Candidatus Ozemobacteraceae bacterium]